MADDNTEEAAATEDTEAQPYSPGMRYFCAGANRKDEDTGLVACDYRAAKYWYTACPKCGNFYACLSLRGAKRHQQSQMRLSLADLHKVAPMEYLTTTIPEVDLILGGGLVLGKTVLFGGERGTGKTRLLLQVCDGFATADRRALFASGEDDRDSVAQFAQQLGLTNKYVDLYGNPKGIDIDELLAMIEGQGIRLLVIDSLQVCEKSDVKADVGQVAQIDAVINRLTSHAKENKLSVIMIGQLNKEGNYAGSEKVLHLVDVLVRFDPKTITDDDGIPIEGTENICELWLDGKSRQGGTNITALLEKSSIGKLEPLSRRMRAKVSKLELVR